MCRKFDCAMAESNLIALQENPYPGRGLVVGVDHSGENLVQVYWIMGRSTNSRNRVFSVDGGRLFTEAADPSKMENPSLIIYNAMREKLGSHGPPSFYIVSNGDQTDTVFAEFDALIHPYYTNLQTCLSCKDTEYEPDAPNFTSRITAVTHHLMDSWRTEIVVLRKSPWSDACHRFCYDYSDIPNGMGFCVTTYSGDGNPLPAFVGEPLLMPLPGDINGLLSCYWSALNENNRVSLAVKFISIATGKSAIVVQNKFSKA